MRFEMSNLQIFPGLLRALSDLIYNTKFSGPNVCVRKLRIKLGLFECSPLPNHCNLKYSI